MKTLCDELDCKDLERITESTEPYCWHFSKLITKETIKGCKYLEGNISYENKTKQ